MTRCTPVRAVGQMYRRSGFDNDRERVEHLFAMYEQMDKLLLVKNPRKRRKG
ncbi:MAG: hypothetical protein L3J36_10710 [Rhodobacteraceae bacterium]|nr:hypothetical protein [Paracoccaceae bacterium]